MKENKIENVNNRMRRKRGIYGITPAFAALILLALLACVMLGVYLYHKYMPNRQQLSPMDYYSYNSDKPLLVFGDVNVLDGSPVIVKDGVVFLPSDYIEGNIDQYFFWEQKPKRLTITTLAEVVKITPDVGTYTINGSSATLDTAFFEQNGLIYAPQDFLSERYALDIGYNEDENIVFARSLYDKQTAAVAIKDANIRYEPSIKSEIAYKLKAGEGVSLFGASEDEKYYKVRTASGIVGYVLANKLTDITETAPQERPEPEQYTIEKPIDGNVILVWDQITVPEANKNDERFVKHNGVNVLSPTWFTFDISDGLRIVGIPDKDYVKFAHDNNYRVWALVSDDFKSEISNAVISRPSARDYTINTLLDYVEEYELDGINIDFEQVREDDAKFFIQFLRELSVPLHALGKTLSVDTYVPSPWSMYYNRTEIGKTADYVCVMAYDEHYAGSSESGPVASIGFVENGIRDTLDEVPKEKVLMGIPFYVRIWKEENISGEMKLSSSARSMEYAYNFFEQAGCEFTWLPESALYYAEFTTEEDGNEVTYRVWLEDERSITEKLKIASKYDIAGVACWRRGLEKEVIWDIIAGKQTL